MKRHPRRSSPKPRSSPHALERLHPDAAGAEKRIIAGLSQVNVPRCPGRASTMDGLSRFFQVRPIRPFL